MVNVKEELILDDKSIREKCIERTEVLDKVKKLLLIPQMECMTIRQVAEYYEVDITAINKCYQRNRVEIDNDGVVLNTPKIFKKLLTKQNVQLVQSAGKTMTSLTGQSVQLVQNTEHNEDSLTVHNVPLVQNKTHLVIQIDDNTRLEIPNRGIKCFSKRAILRIGMLLRDSKIAQEVRTQLLNIIEHTAEEKPELITMDIDEEQRLQLNIGKAFASGDMMELAAATQAYSNFQKRHIQKLETENTTLNNDKKLLTAEILDLSDRKMLSAVIRKLASILHMDYSMAWGCLYKQLNYRYGINLKARGNRKKPYIQYVRNDEWDKVQKCIVALLEDNGINASEFIKTCKPANQVHNRKE